MPVGVRGLADVTSNAIHSTGVGLLLYGRDHLAPNRSRAGAITGKARGMAERMRDWFQGNF
jgi:cell division protein FtsA